MDDEEQLIIELHKFASCFIVNWVPSTLLFIQELEGTQAFLSWQQDKASKSSRDLSKQFLDDMQGLSTLTCMTFIVLCVFRSKDEALQHDRDKRSSKMRSLSCTTYHYSPSHWVVAYHILVK